MKRKSDFTLVELVIVIACVAALMVVFVGCNPLGRARARAKATECLNNQAQTAKLVILAMGDNRDFLVSGSSFADIPGDSPAWTRFLYGEGNDIRGAMKGKKSYIADMAMLRCPAFKYDGDRALGAMDARGRKKELAEAYGLVYREKPEPDAMFAGFDFRGTRFLNDGSQNISPGQLILGGCAAADGRRDRADALLFDGAWRGRPARVHIGKYNVFFLDGHADNMDREELENMYLPSANDERAVKFSGF